MRELLLILMLGCLTACTGWQLRGGQDPALLADTQVNIAGRIDSSLEQLMVRSFRGGDSSRFAVRMLSDSQTERVETLTARLHQGIVRIERQVTYELVDRQTNDVLGGETRLWRDLEVDEANPASTEREKDLLEQEMNRDILDQVLSHLERFRDAAGA